MSDQNLGAELLRAVHFAADKHRDQRRKGAEASPYINHPIEVAELLARVGGVTDLVTLQAALLHDTIEDTQTTGEELEDQFGAEVRRLVEEVSDNKSLPKLERKRLQVAHASEISPRAQKVKLADKLANIRSVMEAPPTDWPPERQQEYLDWSERVVAGLRGCNPELEQYFDELLAEARRRQ
jgi:(p)ppGpp synthase/HD superfamily hydrolase